MYGNFMLHCIVSKKRSSYKSRAVISYRCDFTQITLPTWASSRVVMWECASCHGKSPAGMLPFLIYVNDAACGTNILPSRWRNQVPVGLKGEIRRKMRKWQPGFKNLLEKNFRTRVTILKRKNNSQHAMAMLIILTSFSWLVIFCWSLFIYFE